MNIFTHELPTLGIDAGDRVQIGNSKKNWIVGELVERTPGRLVANCHTRNAETRLWVELHEIHVLEKGFAA